MQYSAEILEIIKSKTPAVDACVHDDYYRHDVIRDLQGSDNIGIELGVAGGDFSRRMVESGKFRHFFGVDLYEDHHNTAEYKRALKFVGLGGNYTLLRMSFDEANDLFEDSYFDFIYFDGYAHTGEEGGKTFQDWYAKLKPEGVFAGDDYHQDWPLVIWAVNALTRSLGVELHVTGQRESTNLNLYPSWFFRKSGHAGSVPEMDADLLAIGRKIRSETRKTGSSSDDVTLTLEQIVSLVQQVRQNHPQLAAELVKILTS